MWDIVYIAGTAAFFVIMVIYVRACERLGRSATQDEGRES